MNADLKSLPEWLDLDDCRSARWPMNLVAFVETKVQPTQLGVRAVNICARGGSMVVAGGLSLERYVTLLLPGSITIEGWIAWSNSDHAGLDYARSLPAPVVERLISDHRGAMVD
jgi:hypothetical protein